jgi:hypothetical protein
VGTTIEATSASAPPAVTPTVHRITDGAESLVISTTPPVIRPEGDAGHVLFSLTTAALEPGRYVIALKAQPAADAAVREVVIELRP